MIKESLITYISIRKILQNGREKGEGLNIETNIQMCKWRKQNLSDTPKSAIKIVSLLLATKHKLS